MNYRYTPTRTALLFVDPYNDFLSEGGKLWPMVKEAAVEVGLLENLRAITKTVRHAGIQVFVVPHHRSEPADFAAWDHPSPYQLATAKMQVFARDSWGGEWHPDFAPRSEDIIAKEHWASSGFANTDLDLLLKEKKIIDVIMVGLMAITCIETTARFAAELGYRVTLVKDATAAASKDRMKSAHEQNGPTFAHDIVTTSEVISALSVV